MAHSTQLVSETLLISGFQQARTECTVDNEGGTTDGISSMFLYHTTNF